MFKNLFKFPMWGNKNIRLFYLIEAGLSFWLVEAIWFFYWGKFADFYTLGIVFSTLTVVWILMEIPTGAIADMFGRKTSTIIGAASLLLGSVIIAATQNIWYLIFGGLFQNIGRAFISGSLEALIYDDLKNDGQESWFDDIMSAKSRLTFLAYGVATIAGGFLFTVYFRLPHIITALAQFILLILTLMLTEKINSNRPRVSFKSYLLQNLEGFKQLNKKSLRPYLILIIAVMTVFYLYDWGFSKPVMATSFGFNPEGMGIIYALMSVVNIFVVGKLVLFRKKIGDFKGMIYLNLFIGLGFALSALPWGFAGLVILFMIEAVGALSDPWISVIVNKEINSQDRATTLSSLVFLSKIPYVALILFAGNSIQNHTISTLHLIVGVLLILIASGFFILNRFYKKTGSGFPLPIKFL